MRIDESLARSAVAIVGALAIVGCSVGGGKSSDPTAGNGSGGASETGTMGGQASGGSGGGASPTTGGAPTSQAGAAPTAEPTGTGGTPDPMPTAEPSNVTFDWPEANLGGSGGCKSGRYVGEFEGVYTSPATVIGIPLDVSGDVDFTLLESQNGEFFEISNGKVIGTANTGGDPMSGTMAQSGIPFEADIVGTLNCTTGTLEDAGLKNGFYNVMFPPFQGAFEGPITGVYDKNASSFPNGTWSVVEPNQPPNFGGSGTWNATWVQ